MSNFVVQDDSKDEKVDVNSKSEGVRNEYIIILSHYYNIDG